MNKDNIKQGEVWMCNLSKDTIEHEQKGVRPCLVISVDVRNSNSSNVFIFPITHAKKKEQPCHYKLYKQNYPFFHYKENIVLCEEGRSISKNRLQRKIGIIKKGDIVAISGGASILSGKNESAMNKTIGGVLKV